MGLPSRRKVLGQASTALRLGKLQLVDLVTIAILSPFALFLADKDPANLNLTSLTACAVKEHLYSVDHDSPPLYHIALKHAFSDEGHWLVTLGHRE